MNRLQHEISPYLLQHAHNPVDWYAWRPEAFERAKAEEKPILVSIGYSTCHWCHVMERESFEDEGVAALMNEHFICIKVDREERPDVDAIYMEACQILTGGGGWPLNCFLTPDGKPFYAGTYFLLNPPTDGLLGRNFLQHLAGIWAEKRDVALEQAEKLMGHIRRNDDVLVTPPSPPGGGEKAPLLAAPHLQNIGVDAQPSAAHRLPATLYAQMRDRFDREEGGFGGAPKFPSTMAIQFLLNFHWYSGSTEALEHALLSLNKMIQGGIYDQLGGGFARYATDREWLVPHFEKMLYDNALLVTVLSDAYKLARGNAELRSSNFDLQTTLYQETIEETLAYIAREMTSPEGGFYSAQDADSEGVEGKFYVWGKAEVQEVLGDDADLFCAFYDVTEHGNWEEKNILWRLETYEKFAEGIQRDTGWLKAKLRDCREKLFAVRSQRIWPGLDNKILLSWNALMVSAYTSAFTALGHEDYRQAAVRNIDFLLKNFSSAPSSGHSLRHSLSQPDAFLEDYTYLIAALVDLYQITFEARYLHLAGKYADHVLSAFHDVESGLFFFTAVGQSDIVLRKKDLYDNATPSGNSTMVHNLQRLGILLDRTDWREQASKMLQRMQATVERFPLSFERWATALLNEAYPAHEIAVVGNNAFEKALALQRLFLPNKVVAASRETTDNLSLLNGKTGGDDALIYVCRDFACQRPISTIEEFRQAVVSS